MPENDIYNNKEKYEGFLRNLDLISIPPAIQDLIQKKPFLYL